MPVCRPITTTKCDDVTYTKCEEVPDQVCSSVEIPVPAQQQLHKQEISYFIEKSAYIYINIDPYTGNRATIALQNRRSVTFRYNRSEDYSNTFKMNLQYLCTRVSKFSTVKRHSAGHGFLFCGDSKPSFIALSKLNVSIKTFHEAEIYQKICKKSASFSLFC